MLADQLATARLSDSSIVNQLEHEVARNVPRNARAVALEVFHKTLPKVISLANVNPQRGIEPIDSRVARRIFNNGIGRPRIRLIFERHAASSVLTTSNRENVNAGAHLARNTARSRGGTELHRCRSQRTVKLAGHKHF
jgi:hypothetical protein